MQVTQFENKIFFWTSVSWLCSLAKAGHVNTDNLSAINYVKMQEKVFVFQMMVIIRAETYKAVPQHIIWKLSQALVNLTWRVSSCPTDDFRIAKLSNVKFTCECLVHKGHLRFLA
jgi:hypothetical protein